MIPSTTGYKYSRWIGTSESGYLTPLVSEGGRMEVAGLILFLRTVMCADLSFFFLKSSANVKVLAWLISV